MLTKTPYLDTQVDKPNTVTGPHLPGSQVARTLKLDGVPRFWHVLLGPMKTQNKQYHKRLARGTGCPHTASCLRGGCNGDCY